VSAVAQAKAAHQEAVAAERDLQRAVVDGDDTITAADLAEAEAAVRLAALRVQSAERIAKQEADARYEKAQAARRERAMAAKEQADQIRREGWQRAIESGEAARHLESHRMNGSGSIRPNLPREYEDMLIEAGLLEPRQPVKA
jgi:FtsZ-interacting cell division protein YlmF